MAYNTTASLNKLTRTDYVDFGKCQDRFGSVSWSKNDSNYLDIKLKVFNREDKNAEFRARQNFLLREAEVYSPKKSTSCCSSQLSQRKKLSSVLQSTLFKDMEEQLMLVHMVIDIMD